MFRSRPDRNSIFPQHRVSLFCREQTQHCIEAELVTGDDAIFLYFPALIFYSRKLCAFDRITIEIWGSSYKPISYFACVIIDKLFRFDAYQMDNFCTS